MREGKITSFCERGVSAGQYRLTSIDENRRFGAIVDEGATSSDGR